jgi:signal transduction histidine kinase
VSAKEAALSELAHGLLAAASQSHGGVEPALERLRDVLGVERVSVLGYSVETARLITLYHARRPGVALPPEAIEASLLPRAVAALQLGTGFRYELPADVPEDDRPGVERLGARSILGAPLVLGPDSWGWVVFESFGDEPDAPYELAAFSAAARIVEDALAGQRARAEEHCARARAEHELAELLTAFVGHDLRNPLSAISGLTQLIKRREGLPEDVVRRVGAIDTAVTRTNQWLVTLLDFLESRGALGLVLQRGAFDLRELLARVLHELLASRPDRPITVEGPSTVSAIGDAARITQLVTNLLANAQSSSDGSEPVQVQLASDGEGIVLTALACAAQPPASLESLFDPFGARGPAPSRPRSLRLGLYMARRIAECHGGSLLVERTAASKILFTVRIP